MADIAEIFDGRVYGIMNFGAFVRLKDGSTGLVHISEISDGFVQDVKDYLKVGQNVKVVVLDVDADGKKKLSIKRVASQPRLDGKTEEEAKNENKSVSRGENQKFSSSGDKKSAKKAQRPVSMIVPTAMYGEDDGGVVTVSFEDKLARFMKSSEERLVDVKHQTENKRGGGYVRR